MKVQTLSLPSVPRKRLTPYRLLLSLVLAARLPRGVDRCPTPHVATLTLTRNQSSSTNLELALLSLALRLHLVSYKFNSFSKLSRVHHCSTSRPHFYVIGSANPVPRTTTSRCSEFTTFRDSAGVERRGLWFDAVTLPQYADDNKFIGQLHCHLYGNTDQYRQTARRFRFQPLAAGRPGVAATCPQRTLPPPCLHGTRSNVSAELVTLVAHEPEQVEPEAVGGVVPPAGLAQVTRTIAPALEPASSGTPSTDEQPAAAALSVVTEDTVALADNTNSAAPSNL